MADETYNDQQHVEKVLSSGMTALDLIEELKQYPADCPVVFLSNYGDHMRTIQALPVNGIEVYKQSDLYETAYSQSHLGLNRDADAVWSADDCEDEDGNTTAVITFQ